MVWTSDCSRSLRRTVSPAPPSKSTLSGTTTRGPPVDLEHGCDVLDEVELLVGVVAQKSSRLIVDLRLGLAVAR